MNQPLADDKIRAEIYTMGAQIEKMRAEVEKIRAEALKERRSSAKILVELIFYPFVAGAGCVGGFLALAKYLNGN
ncbi:hypothetical protein [Cardiobacterium valvarum]|uniref:Uncharacterized protein n=1 Tax=Cardiobacterium valvarum F0432 TaxID=797473 RepID=G9ZJB4_9GAMM|nr:hypothetical protein [Cardiobacterium valvarum]EHM50255.1 hypothetical protein HMPREF9080_02883 [Cardiobacterium valvarum F0432]